MTKRETRFLAPYKNASEGLIRIASGRQFQIGLAFGLTAVTLSWVRGFTIFDKMVITTFVFLVLCLEGMNSALEKLLNLLHPTYNKEVGIIKDMLAGTVLLAAIGAGIIGILVLAKVFQLLE